MKHTCPCCNKEFTPPAALVGVEEDIGSLFSCDYCQSVLKWEGGVLKVVHESKQEPEPITLSEDSTENEESLISKEDALVGASDESDEMESQNDIQQMEENKEESIADFITEGNNPEEVRKDFDEEGLDDGVESSFMPGQELQDKEPYDETAEENGKKEAHQDFKKNEQIEESSVENLEKEQVEEWKEMEEEVGVQETNQNFADVEEYGNAQATSEKGFLRYDIYISGLDSIEIEEQIKEVLEDPRFKWDANEILGSQNKGLLVIKNLNPIKAVCLISELSFLSIDLSWKQYMALNVPSTQDEE